MWVDLCFILDLWSKFSRSSENHLWGECKKHGPRQLLVLRNRGSEFKVYKNNEVQGYLFLP